MGKPIQQRVRLVRKNDVRFICGTWFYHATFKVEVAYGTFYQVKGCGKGATQEEARNRAKYDAHMCALFRWNAAKREKEVAERELF